MRGLNIGCGSRFHPAWTNVDIAPADPRVRRHDARKGLPFPDGTFDAVYHSHLLEHLPASEAVTFTKECFRVLRSGGVIRVVVPDLENIAGLYLEALDRASRGQREWQERYDWMMLELYDQAVREYPGGRMLEHVRRDPIPAEAFVRGRLGNDFPSGGRSRRRATASEAGSRRGIRHLTGRVVRVLRAIREVLLRMLLRAETGKVFRIAHFRRQGEIHLWMYDRHSLGRLLLGAGFQDPRPVESAESRIPGWTEYHLDCGPDASVHKPASLYMEAVKP